MKLAQELGRRHGGARRRTTSRRRWSTYARAHNLSTMVSAASHAASRVGWPLVARRAVARSRAGTRSARLAPRHRPASSVAAALRGRDGAKPPPMPSRRRRPTAPSAAARLRPGAGRLAAATTLAAPCRCAYFDLANIVMLFLLARGRRGAAFGRGPAVLAAFVNVAAFDFFFVAPRLSFAVTDVQYLLTFAVMLIVGLVIGQLTAGLRYQAPGRLAPRGARARALRVRARPVGPLPTEQVGRAATRSSCSDFRATVAVLCPTTDDRLPCRPRCARAGARPRHGAMGASTTASPPAWAPTPCRAAPGSTCRCGRRCARAACWRSSRTQPRLLLVPEQRRQLDTFAALVAIALERVHYVEVAQARCRWNRSGCATRCCRRCRTTCARR